MPKRILTVDDSSTMRQMVGLTLKTAGFEVLEAADGVEALEKLRQSPTVDLVLTDLNMPRMDGLELTRQIRAMASGRAVPIILLTTESSPEMKLRGKSAGATGWIVKPFQPNQLLEVIGKVAR
ncbi:MAG: response regulator [Acidobacteria bacterium]|nr:response regulator [Acidobacteriota bacterium]